MHDLFGVDKHHAVTNLHHVIKHGLVREAKTLIKVLRTCWRYETSDLVEVVDVHVVSSRAARRKDVMSPQSMCSYTRPHGVCVDVITTPKNLLIE